MKSIINLTKLLTISPAIKQEKITIQDTFYIYLQGSI